MSKVDMQSSSSSAAVAQAGFFISAFFGFQFSQGLFVLATLITAAQLIEEIVLVILLPEWKTDVKGLYWVFSWQGWFGKYLYGWMHSHFRLH